MGFRFKKFRAQLTWKSKKPPPEVVCLRYQLNSEFEESPPEFIPATSSDVAARLRSSERKLGPKLPSVQNLFENKPKSDNNTTSGSENAISKSEIVARNSFNDNLQVSSPEQSPPQRQKAPAPQPPSASQPPKGILKKSNYTDQQTEVKSSIDSSDKKSTLIYMTENHEDVQNDELKLKSDLTEAVSQTGATGNRPESPEASSRNERTLTPTDFQVHVVNHASDDKPEESDDNENEQDEAQVDGAYESRGGYSSQAASIFFAGEEPEPAPRVRKVVQDDSDNETDNVAKA